MYKVSEIQEGLLHEIGFRQNHDTAAYTIADSLLQSDSGLYFQDAHPLLTLDNLVSIAPDFNGITYDAWVGGVTPTQYYQYDRVTYNTKNYRAKTNNINKQPDVSPDDWERFDEFSEWLEDKIKGSIIRSIQKYLNERKVIKTARSIFENKQIFNGAGSLNELINNEGNWAVFEIVPKRYNGVNVKINKIGFQSNSAETFDVYLFHSSSKEYIKKQSITVGNAYTFEWNVVTDWELKYVDTTNAGGSWFIAYNQNDLTGKAINTIRDWSKKPCNCNRADYNLYNLWSRYLNVNPMRVPYIDENLWDIEDNIYLTDTNFGLNLDISVYCDYTDVIIEQKDLFKDLIYYGFAMDMMREFAYNPNVNINRNQKNALPSVEKILYEIEGDSRGKEGGLLRDFRLAMDAIKLDFNGITAMCDPCRKTGVRYGSI